MLMLLLLINPLLLLLMLLPLLLLSIWNERAINTERMINPERGTIDLERTLLVLLLQSASIADAVAAAAD